MISCTEFIPAYSELFNFVDRKSGRQAVYDYWRSCVDPERAPINEHLKKSGIRGCWDYWTHTLNEEAADFSLTLDEDAGYFRIDMHHCPSKGRLISLPQIEPFEEYCLHCDLYRLSVEQYGLKYVYDFSRSDKAQCSLLIYDPAKYTPKEGERA